MTHTTQPRTIAIIQARRAASRLPDKVLLNIAGEPMLVRVIERSRRARTVDAVAVATTDDPWDDAVEALCRARGYPYYRGSMFDVLDRYYQAARVFEAEIIVRITADCPVIDPTVIDTTVDAFFGKKAVGDLQSASSNQPFSMPFDFAANRLPPPWGRTYPIGLDTEICTFQALETAWKEATLPYQREHVMPYLYENASIFDSRQSFSNSPPDIPAIQPRFRALLVNHEPDYGSLRWTVDTPQDLELVRQIYASFPGREDFSWLEILSLFECHPELAGINAQVQPKNYKEVDSRSNR